MTVDSQMNDTSGTNRRIRRKSVWRRQCAVMAGLFVGSLILAACGPSETAFPTTANRRSGGGSNAYQQPDSVLGQDGFNLFNTQPSAQGGGGEGGGGIGVNSFLWRASLDTISFMPLASADPFGGVIITDWYSPPESQAERFKVNVYILGRDLRADGVRAAVFRQTQVGAGDWVDAQVIDTTGTDLENAILTRARQLRIATLQ